MAFPIEGRVEARLVVSVDDDPRGYVPYWLAPLSRGHRMDNTEEQPKGISGAADVMVKGTDEGNFLNYMAGFSERTGTGSSAALSRTPPHRHPQYGSNLYCNRILETGLGAWVPESPYSPTLRGWPSYEWVRYQIGYDTRSFKVAADATGASELRRYVTRRRQQRARERFIPSHYLVLDDGTTVPETGFVYDRACDWTYTWHQIPFDYYPRQAIADLLGLVNDSVWDTVTPEGENHPAESLLFRGVSGEDRPYYLYDGTCYVDLVYRFERRLGRTWNQYPKPDGTAIGWQYRPLASPPKRLYKTGDFNRLFKVA